MSVTIENIGKVQTVSLIAGSRACDGRCPYCVSEMTPDQGMTKKFEDIDGDRFRRLFEYAVAGKAETIMITGKGEPTLMPDHISRYLNDLLRLEKEYGFRIPYKELQTNGISIANGDIDNALYLWKAANLHKVAISIVHFDPEENRRIFIPYKDSYIDLPKAVEKLHAAEISVRLACVLFDGGIDNSRKLKQLIEFAKDNNVEELTIRPVNMPAKSSNPEVAEWVKNHMLRQGQLEDIDTYLNENGKVLQRFPFGGTVYSIYTIRDQNVCNTTCLTKDKPTEFLRQLIFYPNGIIATDWTGEGEGLV